MVDPMARNLMSQRGSCGGQASPSDASRVSQWTQVWVGCTIRDAVDGSLWALVDQLTDLKTRMGH